jgi:Carboxypeptidase regulatory-like domain
MKQANHRILASCIVLYTLCAMALAQVQTTTAITGTVTDSSGALLPGVEVVVTDQDTGTVRRTITNDSGLYVIQSLKPGTYSISASLTGFKTAVVKDRQVQVTIPAQVNLVMQVGELAETVTVSGVGEEMVNKTTAQLATTINENLVKNLPVETRNYFDLVALAPNTAPEYLSGSMSFGQHSMRRVNAANSFESSGVFAAGERDSSSFVSIDGASTQIANYNQTVTIQSASTIKELRLETASANAEFGNGANAVNVITKSGTNDFHGEVFWQHRNDNLDAVGYFTNLAGRQLPEYKRNKFGGTIGGPIIKNKLLFFANYEGSRLRQAVQGNTRVPTALERSGDFSQTQLFASPGVLAPPREIYNPFDYDPATGLRAAFPNKRIPSTLLDPAIQVAFKYTPLPNTIIDGIPQYSGLNRTDLDENQYTTRIDWQKSEKTLVYGRWTWAERKALNSGLLPPLQGESTPASSKTIVVNWTQVISSTKLNDLSVSYVRPKWGIGRPIANVPDVAAEMGLKNASTFGGSPSLGVTDFTVASSGLFVWDPTQNTYQAKDDYSFTIGRHSFKVGAHLTDRRLYYLIASSDKGRFNFLETYTRPCPQGPATSVCNQARTAAGIPDVGLALADMVLGASQLVDLQLRGVVWHGQQKYFGGYFQDTWQVSQKLTINMGLRYEYWRPWTLPRNAAATFDFSGDGKIVYSLQNPLDVYDASKDYGRDAPLNPNVPRQGYTTSNVNLGPRLGFAYTATPNTVIRVAGGIFYAGNINVNQMSDNQSGTPPFTLQGFTTTARTEQLPPILVRNSYALPAPTSIPTPYSDPLPTTRVLGEDYYPTPAVYQWSFGLQQRINASWAVNLDYIGSHTIHNSQFVQFNPGELPQGPLANLSLQERRRLKGWGSVDGWVPWGSGKYQSGTAGIKNREWHGLSFMSNLTWAKNLTTSHSLLDSDRGNNFYRFYDSWRGRSNYIPTLRNISAWSYRLPFGRGMKYPLRGVADAVAGGWTVSGITEFSTGAPTGVTSNDNSGTGTGYQRPNLVNGCDMGDAARDRFQWFNTACFVDAAFGTFGTANQGLIDEPGINNWNITLKKGFFFAEGKELEFRGELFNAFNVTQWGTPTTSLASTSFGRIGSTRPARQLQFGLFFTF